MRIMLKDTPNKTRHETEENKRETTCSALGMWNKTVIAPLTIDKSISSIKLTLIRNENWGRACMCVTRTHTKETTWYGSAMCNKDSDYTIN